jgi:rhodanese-related sulfurtransferase
VFATGDARLGAPLVVTAVDEGRQTERVTTSNAPVPDRSEVSVSDVPALLEQGAALLDVREPHEWVAGHAVAATHVPLSALSPDNLPAGEPLLVVCHIGGRSAMATQALRRAGYPAVNVAGGMDAWQQAGLPVVTDDGRPGRIV